MRGIVVEDRDIRFAREGNRRDVEFDMNNKLSLALLAGSRAIDQMRKDIEDLAPMLEGLVRQALSGYSSVKESNSTCIVDGCRWSIKYSVGNMNPSWDFFKIEAWTGVGKCAFVYPKKNSYKFHASDVLVVHRNLDALVQTLRKEVPELDTELVFFCKAADPNAR